MSATDLLAAHLRDTDTSQRQFSRDHGIPQSTISGIISGKIADIDKATAEKLSPILGRGVAELMGIEAGAPVAIHPAAAPAIGADTELLMIPWAEIAASLLNPRRAFDEDAIRELADSLYEHGQMQNIVVRRIAFPRPNEGKYQIVAGERRYRATGYNIVELKRWRPDQPMLAKVIEAGDDQHRALALLENLQRVDLSPIEEAEAFHTLMELNWSTAEIADRIHKTQRFVQQRVSLVTKLSEETKTALSEGRINIDQARALTTAAPKQQRELLKKIESGFSQYKTADDIRHQLTRSLIPIDRAIFPRDRYIGEIRVNDLGQEFFAEVDVFKELQKAGVEDLVAEKKRAGWSWVKVTSYLDDYAYINIDDDGYFTPSADKKEAGVIIEVDYNSCVTVHEGLIRDPKYADDIDDDDVFDEGDPGAGKLREEEAEARKKREEKEKAKRDRQRAQCEALEKQLGEAVLKDPKFALRMVVHRYVNDGFEDPEGFEAQPWSKIAEMTERQLGAYVIHHAAASIVLNQYDEIGLDIQALAAANDIALPKFLRLENPAPDKMPGKSEPDED